MKFFDKIAPTLEEVELGYNFPFDIIAYVEIFKKRYKLRVMDIFIKFGPKDLMIYQKLIPNHSLQELSIQDYHVNCEEVLKTLIVNAPNLETLNIRGDDISKDLFALHLDQFAKIKTTFCWFAIWITGRHQLTKLDNNRCTQLKEFQTRLDCNLQRNAQHQNFCFWRRFCQISRIFNDQSCDWKLEKAWSHQFLERPTERWWIDYKELRWH